MGLRLYCNRYAHFKDPLVCSVSCPYRTRCHDFALFYDEHRQEIDQLVTNYYAARQQPDTQPRTLDTTSAFLPLASVGKLRSLLRLEVKRVMPEASYIWIGKDDQAELLELEEIIRRAERGAKAKHIFKVSQEMELRYQLVPRKRIEKAKRVVAAEAERTAARRKASRPSRPVPVETPAHAAGTVTPITPGDNVLTAPATRRTRTRRTA